MAKPNYQFEKRQRDLAKKRKQEEKLRQKLANKTAADGGGADAAVHPDPATQADTDNPSKSPSDDGPTIEK